MTELLEEMHTSQIESLPWTEKTGQASTLDVDTQYLDPRSRIGQAVTASGEGGGKRAGPLVGRYDG